MDKVLVNAYHILVKPTGAVCNLDCKYCFFLSKRNLYPEDRTRMSDETLELYIRQLLEPKDATEVSINWQGGEPTLMGLDFFRRVVEITNRYRRPDQKIQNTIQTNGVILNDEWCAFFKKHDFLVGLNVDGPREMHDVYRVHKTGEGTFDAVMRGWEALQQRQVNVNVLCSIHTASVDHPLEVYRFSRDEMKASFLQFIPIVEQATEETLPLANSGWGKRPGVDRPLYTQCGELVTNRSIGAEGFGRFLISVFGEWVRHDVGNVFVQTFDATLGS